MLDDMFEYEEASIDELDHYNGVVYFLYKNCRVESLCCLKVTKQEFIVNTLEGLSLLIDEKLTCEYAPGLLKAVHKGLVKGINICHSEWEQRLKEELPKRWRINVLGLGDVGGIMLMGMRLLGSNKIEHIGIYDLDDNKVNRWLYELNQINTLSDRAFPKVITVAKDDLFDCDMFVFCASKYIPPVGSGVTDVRMAQLTENAKIINIYAKAASDQNFKGIFAVVSDPVDLLCRSVLENAPNLVPDQIKGFGLGVMNARAMFYSSEGDLAPNYTELGRAFGPHGKDLVIANNVFDYNDEKSLALTDKTIKANLKIREFGYKPFIAPALSSAALSIIDMIEGNWHYSTVSLEGVAFGCKNRMTNLGVEIEANILDPILIERLNHTYKELAKFNGKL